LDAIVDNPRTLASANLDWMERKPNDNSRDRKILALQIELIFNKHNILLIFIAASWILRHGPSTWKTYFNWHFDVGYQDSSDKEKQGYKNDPTRPFE
jgi:polypeptide N-acetylgalactosaminyltransferase